MCICGSTGMVLFQLHDSRLIFDKYITNANPQTKSHFHTKLSVVEILYVITVICIKYFTHFQGPNQKEEAEEER